MTTTDGHMPEELRVLSCTDCVRLFTSGEAETSNVVRRRLAELAGEGCTVTVGEKVGFRWSRCETCGCDLGGQRHVVTLQLTCRG